MNYFECFKFGGSVIAKQNFKLQLGRIAILQGFVKLKLNKLVVSSWGWRGHLNNLLNLPICFLH